MLHAAPRLIVPRCPREGERLRLAASEVAHARAKRMAPGDAVVLLDGSGVEAHGRFVRFSRGGAEIEVESVVPASPAGDRILLAAAGIRPERLAWMAEKATELGAARFLLLVSERTQAHRAAPALSARLERVIREAAKQSESVRWPSVEGPCTLEELFSRETRGARFLLDSSGAPFPGEIREREVSLAIGPEGGWTEAELRSAGSAGWSVRSLPAGKLRAETAAVAALALARAALEARRQGVV